MGRLLGGAEALCVIAAMSVLLGAYTGLPLRLGGDQIEGGAVNPFNTAGMAFVLALTVVSAGLRWRAMLFVLRHGGPLNLLLGFALASVLWSDVPEVTLRRWVSLTQAALFGYCLLAAFPMARILRLLAASIGLAMLASAAVALALPAAGTMQEPSLAGAWNGVFMHKSHLGSVAALGVLCFGWLWWNEPGRRTWNMLGVLLCIAMAVLAQSRSAQLVILLAVSFAAFLPLLRMSGLIRLWAAYGMVLTTSAFAAVMILFFGDIMDALGKDASLTGRLPGWATLLELALQRPLGGHGYSAFFIADSAGVQDATRHAGWVMWNAHNTYLEILLQLGVPGLALVCWILLEQFARSLRECIAGDLPWASFALIYGLCHLATSAVESTAFRGGDIVSMLLVMLLTALRLRASARDAVFRTSLPRPGPGAHPLYAAHR
jgi:O-antigen ligase